MTPVNLLLKTMIKLLITSDWHIGNQFHSYDRLEDHKQYFDSLVNCIVEEKPDAVLVCGDVFDMPNPSGVSQQLYYDTLVRMVEANRGMKIVVIAGNHDSSIRLEAPSQLLRLGNISVVGTIDYDDKKNVDYTKHIIDLPSMTVQGEKLICLAVPHLRATGSDKGGYSNNVNNFVNGAVECARNTHGSEPIVMMGHFCADGIVLGEDHSEKIVGGVDVVDSAKWNSEIAFTALGHIHKRQRVNFRNNMRYCGSALPMSFNEVDYKHGADIVNIDTEGNVEVTHKTFETGRKLLRIPAEGAERWKELKKLIKALPDKNVDVPYAFVEIHALIDEYDPSLLNNINNAIENKKVLVCRSVSHYPEIDNTTHEKTAARTIDELLQTSTLDFLRDMYRNKYKREMEDFLVKKVEMCEREAKEEENHK